MRHRLVVYLTLPEHRHLRKMKTQVKYKVDYESTSFYILKAHKKILHIAKFVLPETLGSTLGSGCVKSTLLLGAETDEAAVESTWNGGLSFC